MVGEGEDAELRDMQLGQVVKLGAVASVVVSLLDGTRDAEGLLNDAATILKEELNPLGLVELLQALDRRALLNTPRARMVVAQGLVRADIAALQRLAQRPKQVEQYQPASDTTAETDTIESIRVASGTQWECNACNRCCSEQHLLGPLPRSERDAILQGFAALNHERGADPSNFVPLPSSDGEPMYLLRPRDGNCSYLDSDGKCLVHKELGEDLKPSVCRMFPFRGVKTASGWDVGVSLSCPTAAAGNGPDVEPEARRTLSSLRVLTGLLHEVPDTVRLSEDITVPYATYRSWEERSLDRLADEGTAPGVAWVACIEDLVEVCDAAEAELSVDDLELDEPDTSEVQAADPDDLGDIDDLLELPSAEENADHLLKDLALWAELLVGLEASDPMALRRFRSGVLRARAAVGFTPQAAPVLAELHRLMLRRARVATDDDLGEATQGHGNQTVEGDQTSVHSTQTWLEPDVADPEVQRRFLRQALIEKRAFEFGTVARGSIALSVFAGLLGLKAQPGDEFQPTFRDIAYLVHHPQLTDILDTRAVVRATAVDPALHRALLQA